MFRNYIYPHGNNCGHIVIYDGPNGGGENKNNNLSQRGYGTRNIIFREGKENLSKKTYRDGCVGMYRCQDRRTISDGWGNNNPQGCGKEMSGPHQRERILNPHCGGRGCPLYFFIKRAGIHPLRLKNRTLCKWSPPLKQQYKGTDNN